MPTGVQNYQNGKIYKIWSLLTDNIYIGSTTNDLPHRFKKHKYTTDCNSKLLFDEVGFENCKIELIEYYPCNSKLELRKREGELQRDNKDFIVNRRIEGRTKKEHYQDNKTIIDEKNKEWVKKNKEKNLEYRKQYTLENKDKTLERATKYYTENKEKVLEYHKQLYTKNKDEISIKSKEYYQTKKEQIKERVKKYREANKDKIAEKFKEKYTCECGAIINKCYKSKHEKKQKHLNYIQSSSSSSSLS
jgi:hypothetical protein